MNSQKKLKYEIFKRFKLRESPENRIPQLLMLHTRTEAIKMKVLMMKRKKIKEIMIFQILL